MTQKLFIPVLLGTVRQGRRSERVARFLVEQLESRADIETTLIDPRDMYLPMTDEGQDLKEKNTEYRDTIIRADALVIVAPEYNHSFSGSLKRVLDVLYDEYQNKAVGIAGVSTGPWGGARAIEALLPVVRELGLIVSDESMQITKVRDEFPEDGDMPNRADWEKRAQLFVDRLVWLAHALKMKSTQSS